MVDTNIHRSWRSRPKGDHAWSEREQSPEWQAASARVQRAGIAPAEVAVKIVSAIREDRFWVMTHPRAIPAIVARAQRLADGLPPNKVMPEDAFGH